MIKRAISILISIGSVIALLMFFRWATYKGVIAFMLGLFVMAYLLLSKNPALKFIVEYFGAGDSIEEIKK